eukprot:scpid76660/ scgid33565/ Lysophosphatidylcholine acyltransferase 2; 1-acylglycerophosphocholine O-acyltransferase; 1-alkylglycerophosphocholine O-acetyltransferase; Acetyl-CoA:lyso-platelet-activating factor acetyltransferase; Acyltransferase-like 1
MARRGRVRILPDLATSGNPFVLDLQFSALERAKLIVGGLVLLPIRVLLSVLFASVLYVLVTLTAIGWKHGGHLKNWQKVLLTTVIPPVLRCWTFVLGYYAIPVLGTRASASEAPIYVVAPHSHVMEPWLLNPYSRGSPLSKKENEHFPFMGRVIKSSEPIWVDREAKQRSNTVERIVQRVASPGFWLPIVIFPEGTTHNGECVIGFKTGAFRPGLPVQPILFRFGERDVGAYVAFDRSLVGILLLVMMQWRNTFSVQYLPVYTPSDAEKHDAQLYAANVRRLMAAELGKPVNDCGLEDLRLMDIAEGAGLPRECALIEFNLMNRLFQVDLAALKTVMRRFVRMNTRKTGSVSWSEFAASLCWPNAEHAQLLYDEYDTRSGCGELAFREYVVGTLDLAGRVADADNLVVTAFAALSARQRCITEESALRAFHERGHMCVTDAAVRVFLRRATREQELTELRFVAYVEENPDAKVLLKWFLDGVDSL